MNQPGKSIPRHLPSGASYQVSTPAKAAEHHRKLVSDFKLSRENLRARRRWQRANVQHNKQSQNLQSKRKATDNNSTARKKNNNMARDDVSTQLSFQPREKLARPNLRQENKADIRKKATRLSAQPFTGRSFSSPLPLGRFKMVKWLKG